MSTATSSVRHAAFDLLENRVSRLPGSRLINRFIIALIVANGVAVVLESNPQLYVAYEDFLVAFDLFSVVIFTLEYLARLWAVSEHPRYHGMSAIRARVRYALTPLALVDLLAVAPYYLALFIQIDLRYLRLFRLLRLLKLSHYFDGLQVFATVLRREAGAIAGALMIMTVLVVISACLMFTLENAVLPGHFDSIAQAIWWAVVTLTTVGYGDVVPLTFGGKLLGIVIMLCGVGTMALPAGILAARFSEELHQRREVLLARIREALADGTLDPEEEASLEQLQQELAIPAGDLARMIRSQQAWQARHRYCPHCGSSLPP